MPGQGPARYSFMTQAECWGGEATALLLVVTGRGRSDALRRAA